MNGNCVPVALVTAAVALVAVIGFQSLGNADTEVCGCD